MESNSDLPPDSQDSPPSTEAVGESVDWEDLAGMINEVTSELIRDGLIDDAKAQAILKLDKSGVYKLYSLEELRPGFIELISTLTPGTKPVILGRLFLISMLQVAEQMGDAEQAKKVSIAAEAGNHSDLPNLAALGVFGESSEIFTNLVLLNILQIAPETAGTTLMTAILEVCQRLIEQGQLDEQSARSVIQSNLSDHEVLGGLEAIKPGFTKMVLSQILTRQPEIDPDDSVNVEIAPPKPKRRGIFHLGRGKRG